MAQCTGLYPAMTKSHGVMKIEEIIHTQVPRLLVLFDTGQEDIVKLVADILGQKHVVVGQLGDAAGQHNNVVVGSDNSLVSQPETIRRYDRLVLITHCIDANDFRDERVTAFCDYEYLYTKGQGVRRDLARYLGFVLGQIKPHDDLKRKGRTTMLSTTFPDIRAALPNIDILSVGADSVELRVDLLESPSPDGTIRSIPSIEYVGEQVMILRQRTELPIIFTIRCTKENGRFPMGDPMLQYQYLHKAKQWGCEYIDVELWLPEEIRRKLANGKGSSKIISAWHDFSGAFKWSSPEARRLFADGAVYGDVVKMIALVNTMEENYELEYFRSNIQASYPHPPFSGLNMGPVGQLSRTLNKVFTPITHPLLPMIAAPGQLSAAKINSKLHSMGQMPRTHMYAIGNIRKNGQATFFEKCLNELSVPHQLQSIERPPHGSVEHLVRRPSFGGAFISPSLPSATAPYLPQLSMAATATGQIDTVLAHSAPGGKALLGDNATWKGIRATLTTEFVPSAYVGQAALVLASHEAQASAALYALSSLEVGAIYTIGFQAKASVAADVQQFRGVEDMKKLDEPFVIISALPSGKSFVVSPLLKHYSNNAKKLAHQSGKVFVDLSNGISGRGDSVGIARSLGWMSYGVADVNAWTMVETLRLLVGQNVPFDFVRLASGRSLYIY
ncbi:aldolase [Teratosphaeria nubilosa]|uniref:Aldolase n=1 Tax=Teratosphaeria nubilosa TaxID=161662 RepID=A0A6G1LB49_9PEZI|nr:aldolase [Teratosphaeria nubilosa]